MSESVLINNVEFVIKKLNQKLIEKQDELQQFQQFEDSNDENQNYTKLEIELHKYQMNSLQKEIEELKEMITKLKEVLDK